MPIFDTITPTMSSRGVGSRKIPKSTLLERINSEPDSTTEIHDFAVKPVTSTLPDRTQSSTIDPESSSSPTTLLGAKTDMERNQPAITDPKTSGTADSTGANVDTTNVKIGSTPKPGDVQDGTEDAVKRAESGQRISDEEREQLAEAGKLPKDPNDHSGEPMKMHGESKLGDDLGEDSLDGAAKKERAKSVSHEGGGEHGKEQGTGTQYVKSSGLAAEGGDFDASNPGAGREATRESIAETWQILG